MNPPRQIQEILDKGFAVIGEAVPQSEAERSGLVKPEATRLDAERGEWLCVDHPDPQRRRDPRAKRFTVLKDDEGGAGNELVIQTDSLEELLDVYQIKAGDTVAIRGDLANRTSRTGKYRPEQLVDSKYVRHTGHGGVWTGKVKHIVLDGEYAAMEGGGARPVDILEKVLEVGADSEAGQNQE